MLLVCYNLCVFTFVYTATEDYERPSLASHVNRALSTYLIINIWSFHCTYVRLAILTAAATIGISA
jgi:hypothetical protein